MPAFQPETIRFGRRGVVLSRPVDALAPDELARSTNVLIDGEGQAGVRPGLTTLVTGGAAYHSVARLNDPSGAAPTLVWGVDASVYTGLTGALTLRQGGFSGNPLSLVPYRPPNSGQTWLYIADSAKLRKIRPDGLILQVGLPKPAGPTTALAAELTVAIEEFESGFTGRAGTGGAPTLTYPAGKSANALNIQTAPGGATSGYTNYADKGFTAVDLTSFGGGVDATDDDIIHLWLKADRPDKIAEIHLYLVTSTFTGGVVPGTSTSQNTDAYVKAFRPHDLTTFVEEITVLVPTAGTEELIRDAIETSIPEPSQSVQLLAGRGVWTEYGIIGVPLRRSDFQPIGGAPSWSTVRGIVVWVKTTDTTAVNLTIDNLFLRGGRGLDSAEPGAQPYDYRVTNYDPRTGAESNPSNVQAEAAWLDSLRRAITIDPAAFGDASIRQRVYRRGGSITDDWYFVGTNASDGGVFTDTLSDEATVAAGAVAIDHDQPVTTLDTNGAEVFASPAYALWGPVNDLLFLCGDPYRAGHVYTCKQGEPDHWPSASAYEVCSPSEELMNGCVWADQAYVFSRKRLYKLYVNLSGSGGITPVPTGCEKGLAGRWALAPTLFGIAFVSDDNIYLASGGAQVLIADDLRPLFKGETVNGYLPIDFSQSAALRLWAWRHFLWFTYRDTGGVNQTWIYSFLRQTWCHYRFGRSIAFGYDHSLAGAGSQLLLLSRSGGRGYTHTGVVDDGLPISWVVRTGALDQGQAHAEKFYAGDVAVDLASAGQLVTIGPSLNSEAQALSTGVVSTVARALAVCDIFGATEVRGRSISWDVAGQASAPTSLYGLTYTWAIEALPHRRWTSGAQTHGFPALQVPVRATITYRSTASVLLTVTAWQEDGTEIARTYALSATANQKRSVPILLSAHRGVLFTYTLTSAADFFLYEDESYVIAQLFSPPYGEVRYVLGTDRVGAAGSVDPMLAAGRAGGQ